MIPILLIEDGLPGFQLCREELGANFEIWRARDPSSTFSLIKKMISQDKKPCLVITNLALITAPKYGLCLVRELAKEYPDIPIIVWSKHFNLKEKAIKMGANSFVEKHIEPLKPAVDSLLSQQTCKA